MLTETFGATKFTMASMTRSILKLPYSPGRIGQMGLFQERGVTTRHIVVEEKNGVLTILGTKPVGTKGQQLNVPTKRTERGFLIPHIPYDDTILAESIQGIREFGTEDRLQSPTTVVNDKQTDMRQAHEVTHEWLRMGAINGVSLDADGSSVIYNWRTEFETGAEQTVDFDWGASGGPDVLSKCLAAKRLVESALGVGIAGVRVHCFVTSGFFDNLIAADAVKETYAGWTAAKTLRQDNRRMFEFGDIVFEEYDIAVDGVSFIAANTARFFPVGVPGLFIARYAPGNFMGAVNTMGKKIYSSQKVLDHDAGIEIHTESNPLFMCVRPHCLVKGFSST